MFNLEVTLETKWRTSIVNELSIKRPLSLSRAQAHHPPPCVCVDQVSLSIDRVKEIRTISHFLSIDKT